MEVVGETGAAALRVRLEAPERTVGLAALPGLWRHTVIELRCRRPRGIEPGPWLAAALRGALGHALARDAAADPPGRPSGRALLFESFGEVKAGLAMPKPFVPAVEVTGEALTLRVTLFGMADFWRQNVRRALLMVAMDGLAITERGRFRVPLEPLDGGWWRAERVALPEPGRRLALELLTPLALRASGPMPGHLGALVFALLDRVSGLARWQGVRLEADWGAWRRLADGLVIEEAELRPHLWTRRSSRQPGRLIPMRGLLGRIDILDPPDELWPLLALGQLCHAGAHTTQGMGRYRLLVYP